MRKTSWARLAFAAVTALMAVIVITSATATAAPTCNDTWIGNHGPADQPNDWDTAANWSTGSVPTSSSDVCIETGDAVLTSGDNSAIPLASLDVGSSGTAQLTVSIHDVVTSSATTIGSQGTLVLNGTYTDQNAGNAALGGGSVDNQGTIVMEGAGYSATLFGTILNQGTINVPYGTVAFCYGGNGGSGSLDNQGAINVAAPSTDPSYANYPATVQVDSCPLTDDSGGSISNSGSFTVVGGNGIAASYTQGNGTETGNAISLGQDTSLAYTGTGASSVSLSDSLTMTGNLAAGQNLQLNIGVVVTEANSFSSAGQIVLNPSYYSGGGGPAEIAVTSGTFTNTGTITAESNADDPTFAANVVNDGTLIITPGTEVELLPNGTFTNAASGTLEPEISSSASADVRVDPGASFVAGGTLAPQLEGGFTPTVGQAFAIFPYKGSGESGAFATVAGDWHVDYSNPESYGLVYGPAAPTTTTGPTTTSPVSTPPVQPKVTPLAPELSALTGGAALVKATLECKAAACLSYSLVGSVTEHLKGTKVVSLTALQHRTKLKTKVVTVVSARGSLKAGERETLALKLNRAGQALLKRYGKLKVSVVVSAGGKVVKRETVTVTRPKAKAKAKR